MNVYCGNCSLANILEHELRARIADLKSKSFLSAEILKFFLVFSFFFWARLFVAHWSVWARRTLQCRSGRQTANFNSGFNIGEQICTSHDSIGYV